MTPDWKTAMEREAASVDDPLWAAQTRRAVLWAPVRGCAGCQPTRCSLW